MRLFMINIVSATIYSLLMALVIVAILMFYASRPDLVWPYIQSPGFALCTATTIIGFTVAVTLSDSLTLRLAGLITIRLRYRYALAYAILVLALALIGFLPFVVAPVTVTISVISVGVVCGFIAGYGRGTMIDLNSRGQHQMET